MRYRQITTWLEADLVLDTSAHRRVAGVRQRGTAERQLLFRAGEFYVDLQFRRPPGSRQLVLTGQMVGGSDPRANADLPVELASDGEEPARTRTDDLGEFFLACDLSATPTLRFGLDESLGLKLRLPDDVTGLTAREEH